MKKFILYFIKLLLVPILIFGVNIAIDSHSSIKFNKILVKQLNDLDSLTINSNISDRQLVKSQILFSNNIKKSIVLGSSRSMLMGKPIGMNVSNFSMPGAVINDFFNVINLLEEKQNKIDTVYLEISPWIFNKNTGETRFKYWNENKIINKRKIKKLFSTKYFIENINPHKYSPVRNYNDFIRYSDGTIKYAYEYQNADNISLIKKYEKNKEIYHLEGFNSLENLNKNQLKNLILKIKKSGADIILIKHPYPPLINDKIIKRYPNIIKTDSIIKKLSIDLNLSILGSFYPEKLNIYNSDYYDGMHLTPRGLKKLIHH